MSTERDTPELMSRDEPLTDYGRFHRGDAGYLELVLSCAEEAQEIVRHANRVQAPIRIRGSGHSMNGASVPRRGEILISTAGCCHYRFDEDLTVTVGAGAALWDVDQMLRGHGFELLVCNDGGAAASTVGGFASAGGIGAETWLHGGFWETVAEILFVTGSGELMRCTPEEPLFRWMFGSMGQLGLILEVKLRIRRQDHRQAAVYPLGLEGRIPRSRTVWEQNTWLTLFVPEDAADKARAQLQELGRRHRDVWTPRNDYLYFVRFQTFNPPLIYPRCESFVALGIWGTPATGSPFFDFERLRDLEREFAALVASAPTYRRYIQSELTFGDTDFAGYFGEAVFRGFQGLKRDCDPRMLLGRGEVFR